MIIEKKALLLNSASEVLSFVSEKKMLKLLFKEKVEVVSTWEEKIKFTQGIIKLPAIVRLKRYVRKPKKIFTFSRRAIFIRDQYICQYCKKTLTSNDITIDHIVPKSLGGQNTFLNCVSACLTCNNRKGNKKLEDCGMVLINEPYIPIYGLIHHLEDTKEWHQDWNMFLKK